MASPAAPETPGSTPESALWWIATGPLGAGGRKIMGPFGSQELALEVRAYIEKVNAPTTYWVSEDR